jgi:predicted ArsR family transcriptional regulator
MSTATKSKPRGAAPVVRNRILVALKTEGPSTAKALSTSQVQIQNLIKGGFIQAVTKKGEVQVVKVEGQRGRPAHLYTLTIKGRNIATKLVKQAA